MASRSDVNLSCPVCYGIFQEPVLLSCGHSFCRACLQTWWTQRNLMCPVCRRRSLSGDPPQNLALRNLCEDFLTERRERPSAGSASLCSLHSEELRLFCQTHQQPVCIMCLNTETHKNHSFIPINAAVQDYKVILQELLKPLQEKLELCNDIKETFDQTEKDIEAQAQDAERQIKDVSLTLQKILQKEEQTRIAAVRTEKQQKIRMMKRKSEAQRRETEALSDTIRATEETLRAEDLTFLQNYRTAAEIVQFFQLNDPQPISGALIDMNKHLNNLSFKILDKMKMEVAKTQDQPTVVPEPTVVSLGYTLSRLRTGDTNSSTNTDLIRKTELCNTSQGGARRKMEVTKTREQQRAVPEATVSTSPSLAAASSCNTPKSGAMYRTPFRLDSNLQRPKSPSKVKRYSLALNNELRYPLFDTPSEERAGVRLDRSAVDLPHRSPDRETMSRSVNDLVSLFDKKHQTKFQRVRSKFKR